VLFWTDRPFFWRVNRKDRFHRERRWSKKLPFPQLEQQIGSNLEKEVKKSAPKKKFDRMELSCWACSVIL